MTETPRPDPWTEVERWSVTGTYAERMRVKFAGSSIGEWMRSADVDAARAADAARHQQEIAKLEQERDRLKADQQDWRKGVALIASALGDPADNLSCVRIAEIGLTLRANLETADEQLVRLKEQARSISVRLTDAGIGPMTIPEGVTALVHRAEAAEARCATLTAALEEAHALNVNVFSDAEPEMLAYYSEHKRVIEAGRAALCGGTTGRDTQ